MKYYETVVFISGSVPTNKSKKSGKMWKGSPIKVISEDI